MTANATGVTGAGGRENRFMSLAEGDRVSSGRRVPFSSDQAFEALVRAELQKSPYGAIRAVSCQMKEQVLTLRGSVPSYYLKQVAQRLALNVLEEMAVIVNELEVDP